MIIYNQELIRDNNQIVFKFNYSKNDPDKDTIEYLEQDKNKYPYSKKELKENTDKNNVQ